MTADQVSRGRDEATLRERYEAVLANVAAAAERSGRRPEEIVVAAVTKNATMDQIRELIELGHADFAENRVQALVQRAAQVDEFLQRRRQLSGSRPITLPARLRWHMIGHLQRNKVRKVLDVVRLIHSVDSLRLAEEIQAAASRREEPVEVLVQVNVTGAKDRFGIAPAAAAHLVEQIDTMIIVRARGLMCMAEEVDDPREARPVFERCRELMEDIRSRGLGGAHFDVLSMGMSGDYEAAIECGANVVRVGTAIFGPRPADLPDEYTED
jgi:pyridoxal phosphate enzyme (YggS family)